VSEPYASILEDDNWWEPTFLEIMVDLLERRPDVYAAVANEKLWREQSDGSWLDREQTIWPVHAGVSEFACTALDKCGAAKLCNSSMLFRTAGAEAYQIPSGVPIDVSEHFRERVIPHPLLLEHRPLVNYGDTLQTHRTKGHKIWSQYQILLVASVFRLAAENARAKLAADLWSHVRAERPLSRNTLLAAGLATREAADLWRMGTYHEKMLFFRSWLRRPHGIVHARRAIKDHAAHWDFLQRGWFADYMRNLAG
jgi:hypothetical protein